MEPKIWFAKQVFEASTEELFNAYRTYLDWKSVSELWALNVIKRELLHRGESLPVF